MNIHFAALLASLLLAGAVPARAADKPLPPVESFFSTAQIAGAALSPSGRYVAVLVRNPAGRTGLAVMDNVDAKNSRALANYDDMDVGHVAWLNDNRLYYTTLDRSGQFSKADGSAYAINRDGSDERQLTTRDWYFQQEQTGTSVKKRILPRDYVVAGTFHDGSDDVMVAKLTFNPIDYSLENTRPFRLNTKTLGLTDMLSGAIPERLTHWVRDRDGQIRVGAGHKDGRYFVYERTPASNAWREVGNYDAFSGEGIEPVAIDADGSLLAGITGKNGISALHRFDLKTGKADPDPVMSVDGFDFDGVPDIDSETRQIIGFHYVNDAHGTVWVDPAMRELQEKIDAKLPATVNTIHCGNCSSSLVYLVTSRSDRVPAQYRLYNPKTGAFTVLGSEHPKIEAAQMGSRDFVRYAARDGLQIPAYVTTPPGNSKGPYPAIVLVHGGPYMRGATWEWEAETQFLASRGYLVIEPEFRGSTGFGSRLFHAGWKQWGESMQDDLADAAKWAIAKGLADPKRIAIAGASYGGYATLMGLLKNPELFRCGVEWVGVTDIGLMYSVSWSDFSEQWLRYGMRTLVGDPDADKAKFDKNSPLKHAAQIKQPLLMAYGAADRRVPLIHGRAFHDAISETNKNVEWIVYPDEGHGWFREQTRFDFWRRVERFLDTNLKSSG